MKSSKCDHTKLFLCTLHWLPICPRIDYKISSRCFSTFIDSSSVLSCSASDCLHTFWLSTYLLSIYLLTVYIPSDCPYTFWLSTYLLTVYIPFDCLHTFWLSTYPFQTPLFTIRHTVYPQSFHQNYISWTELFPLQTQPSGTHHLMRSITPNLLLFLKLLQTLHICLFFVVVFFPPVCIVVHPQDAALYSH